MFRLLNAIEFIEYPFLNFNIDKMCFFFRILTLITFKFLNKKVG